MSTSRPPLTHLRGYVANAILPEMRTMDHLKVVPQMPRAGHKSHRNLLHVRPENWRFLSMVFRLRETPFVDRVLYYQLSLPKKAVKNDSGDELYFNVAARGYDAEHLHLARVVSITKVTHWVELIALHTAQSVLQAVFPEVRQWHLNSNDESHRDVDSSLMRRVTWVNGNCEETPKKYHNNMNALMVFIQPAWVLSPGDFQQMTSHRKVSNMQAQAGRRARLLRSSERVWAKLWDVCVDSRCPWFVITSYGQWAFGCFTTGWTSAFISPTIPFDSKRPTVMQCLCYWMMSSIGAPGGFVAPQICEPVNDSVAYIPKYDASRTIEYCASQLDSDSEWEGQSQPPGSHHASEWTERGAMSDCTVRAGDVYPIPRNLPEVPLIDSTDWIQEWRSNPLVPSLSEEEQQEILAMKIDPFVDLFPDFADRNDDDDDEVGSVSGWSKCSAPIEDAGDYLAVCPEENIGPDWGGLVVGELRH